MKTGAALSSVPSKQLLISDSYRALNRKLHEDVAVYGGGGHRYVAMVRELCQMFGTRDVLDYGCGKRTLEQALGFEIQNYDPALPGLDAEPQPAVIVVCCDVLEHIEPDCLPAVLADLRRVTRQIAFFTIDTRKAEKTLADGRNAHLIVEGQKWWLCRLWDAGFSICGLTDSGNRIKLTVR